MSTSHRQLEEKAALGFMSRALAALVERVAMRAWMALGIVAIVTLVSSGITLRFLSFRTDRSALISPSEEFHQRWLRYVEEFGDQSEIVVVVEGPHDSTVRAVIDDLGTQLESETELFSSVFYRFDPSGLRSKALQFLNPQSLEDGLRQLSAYRPILAGHWDHAGIEHYSRQLAMMVSGGPLQTADTGTGSPQAPPDMSAAVLPQARALAESLHSFITESGRFVVPWPSMLPEGETLESSFAPQYQLTPSGKMGFLLVTPIETNADFSGSSRSIRRLREVAAKTATKYEGVSIGLTGIPVLEAEEMQRSQADMSWATLISFAGVGLLLLFGFRGWRHPLMAMVMLTVGTTWAFGWATLVVGHLNILSMSFAAILAGLGIDHAIHFLARYLELRKEGTDLVPALKETAESIGTGIVTAAITTALAFGCAAVTRFEGVAELGIIAAGGILLCAATSFVVLPALVAIADRKRNSSTLPTQFQGLFIIRMTHSIPGRLVVASLSAIFVLSCCALRITENGLTSRVTYDANLLNLQAEEVPSVQLLERIFEETQGSLLYAVSMTDDPLKARLLAQEFRALPTVGRVEELASYLPPYPSPETRLLIQGYSSQLEHLSSLPREFPGLDPLSIGRGLEDLYLSLKDRPEVDAMIATQKLDEFLNELERMPVAAQVEVLSNYQYGMLSSLQGQLIALASLSNDEPVTADDFAEPLRSRFVSDHGRWLVRVYPKEQIWDAEPLERFVADVRSVDPEVTGTPLQNHEAAISIRESYLQAALYAAIVVTLVLLADILSSRTVALTFTLPVLVVVFAIYMSGEQGHLAWNTLLVVYTLLAVGVAAVLEPRGVLGTLVSLTPPVLGMAAMFGILALIGQDLNPANMLVLPLILGMEVANGVHAYHDYRHQRGSYRMSSSVINSMMLNSLTTMIGFGSMMVADHRGLASLGLVLTIGCGTCLFVSLVPLPSLLTLVSRRGRLQESPAIPTHTPVVAMGATAASPENSPSIEPRSTQPMQPDAERLPKAG